jgi:hypothetical protein
MARRLRAFESEWWYDGGHRQKWPRASAGGISGRPSSIDTREVQKRARRCPDVGGLCIMQSHAEIPQRTFPRTIRSSRDLLVLKNPAKYYRLVIQEIEGPPEALKYNGNRTTNNKHPSPIPRLNAYQHTGTLQRLSHLHDHSGASRARPARALVATAAVH